MTTTRENKPKIALTGANGFLGFHVRAALRDGDCEVVSIPVGSGFQVSQAREALEGSTKLIHLAGINRGSASEISEGNKKFASQLVSALEGVEDPPREIVYANSIQVGNGTIYGAAKEQAGVILDTAAKKAGLTFRNVELPNLFGEFGRPFYNSVVATFSHQIVEGQPVKIQEDRELQLLHAQNAAEVLVGAVGEQMMTEKCEFITVSGIKSLLEEFNQFYSVGEFPDLSSAFRRDMFNTYRSYTFPAWPPVPITRHADQRGSFFEIVRSRGGTGQTSFSTTHSGVIRGDHFHRRKVERFTVLSGEAEISLRRIFDHQVYTFRITGDEPKSVDMPTFYTHNIRNSGQDTLYTAFWTNDIFDPNHPDTVAESVRGGRVESGA